MRDDSAYRALCDAGVPLFHSFGAAVRGIKALVDFSAFVASWSDPFLEIPAERSDAARQAEKLLAGGDSRRGRVEAAPGRLRHPHGGRGGGDHRHRGRGGRRRNRPAGGHEGAVGRHRPQVGSRPGRGGGRLPGGGASATFERLVASARRQCPGGPGAGCGRATRGHRGGGGGDPRAQPAGPVRADDPVRAGRHLHRGLRGRRLPGPPLHPAVGATPWSRRSRGPRSSTVSGAGRPGTSRRSSTSSCASSAWPSRWGTRSPSWM